MTKYSADTLANQHKQPKSLLAQLLKDLITLIQLFSVLENVLEVTNKKYILMNEKELS